MNFHIYTCKSYYSVEATNLACFIQFGKRCRDDSKKELNRVQCLSFGFKLGVVLLKVMKSCHSLGRPYT